MSGHSNGSQRQLRRRNHGGTLSWGGLLEKQKKIEQVLGKTGVVKVATVGTDGRLAGAGGSKGGVDGCLHEDLHDTIISLRDFREEVMETLQILKSFQEVFKELVREFRDSNVDQFVATPGK